MGNIEERVAYIEGRVEEQGRGMDGIRDAIVHLEERMDARFAGVDARFTSMASSIDERFTSMGSSIDARFASVAARFDAVDRRLDALDARVTALDDKMTRVFMWLVGLNVATLAAVVTSFASIVSLLR